MNVWEYAVTIKVEMTSLPDFEALAEIHVACFAKGWSAGEFRDMLAIGCTQAFIAVPPPMSGGKVMGFGCLRVVAEEAEILTLAVLEEERKRGVGRAILSAMREWAKSQGAATIFLEVGASNIAAIKLYEKNGFSLLSRRKDYYSKPDGSFEDALVMRSNVTNL